MEKHLNSPKIVKNYLGYMKFRGLGWILGIFKEGEGENSSIAVREGGEVVSVKFKKN